MSKLIIKNLVTTRWWLDESRREPIITLTREFIKLMKIVGKAEECNIEITRSNAKCRHGNPYEFANGWIIIRKGTLLAGKR